VNAEMYQVYLHCIDIWQNIMAEYS